MRKRVKQQEHENQDRWLVSYADLVTLLFAFFTVLYAVSEMNSEKSKKFEESVKQYLIKVGVVGLIRGNTSQSQDGNASDKLKQKLESRIEEPLNKFKKKSDGVERLQYKVETYLEKEFSSRDLNTVFADVSPDSVGVRLSLLADNIFESGDIKIKPSALKIINKIADFLKENNYRVLVEGHSTEEGRNKLHSNSWDLAAARSSIIVRYLIKIHKINPKRLVALSFGGQVPFNNENLLDKRNQRLSFLVLTEPLPF